MCPCSKATESRTPIVGECEIHNVEGDVLQEMRKTDECDMEKAGRLDNSDKTIAILGVRLWPQTVRKRLRGKKQI